VPDGVGGATNLDFRMTLGLKGSEGIRFAPVGRQNGVKLASAWPDPSFQGAFLPAERRVAADGFEASWEVSWYGRSYPQQSTDQGKGPGFTADAVEPSLFGVDFVAPVDAYRMVERATKYGVLFIALIFTAFFLFEVLSALRIHTIQYTLVGAAMCLFYLAVLSLSEFIRFACAYWAGALASALLIVLYSLKMLRSGKRTVIVAAALLVIYAYLYVVLQLQDYSLLLGTAGLFVVLGIVMYSTRNMDWSAREA
jgi:inner membrane protein